jgi:hypothetical protein
MVASEFSDVRAITFYNRPGGTAASSENLLDHCHRRCTQQGHLNTNQQENYYIRSIFP